MSKPLFPGQFSANLITLSPWKQPLPFIGFASDIVLPHYPMHERRQVPLHGLRLVILRAFEVFQSFIAV